MTPPIPLESTFRGERPYIQGAALYDEVLAAIGDKLPPGPVSFIFHSILKNQADLITSSQSLRHLREEPAFRAEIRLGSGESLLHAALVESERPVTVREPCDEKEIVATSVIDEATKRITLKQCTTGSVMEQIVAINKHLHFRLLPQLGPKWIFARLELKAPLPAAPVADLTVVLKQVLGNRFTRSEILVDGNNVGFISFSTP